MGVAKESHISGLQSYRVIEAQRNSGRKQDPKLQGEDLWMGIPYETMGLQCVGPMLLLLNSVQASRNVHGKVPNQKCPFFMIFVGMLMF